MVGAFVWTELMSKDLAESRGFYEALLEWKIKEQQVGSIPYRLIHAGDRQIGGMMQITPEMGPSPTHWMTYVSVEDVDARTHRAVELGGQAVVPGQDIPEVGRFSIIADPAGAHISPFKSVHAESNAHVPPQPTTGTFCWYELLTRDPEGARKFYPEIFGWSVASDDSHGGDPYWMFKAGEKLVAGIQPVDTPPHWLVYVAVEDVDETVKKAVALGGGEMVPPTDIGGMGRFAVLQDNLGGAIGCFERF